MNETTKIIIGIIVFFVVVWGLQSVFDGENFFAPTIEIIDLFGTYIGDLISSLLKIALFVIIIWLVYLLFSKKS